MISDKQGRISENLVKVHARIDAACTEFGRPVGSVRLLAVSKTFPPEALRQAYAAGQRAFGENYIQEGVQKVNALRELPDVAWHMIGPIQSNKTSLVAEHFDWAHSVDRLKTAQRLSQQRPADLARLQVCLQVNVDGSASKSGCSPAEVFELARAVSELPRLQLRGLMVIPDPADDFAAACASFKRASDVFLSLKAAFPALDTLSMGMSGDLRAAIKEGTTMVRVGTAIFGLRS